MAQASGRPYRETDLWVAIDAGHYRKEAERFTMDRISYYRGMLEKHIASPSGIQGLP
ncbi:MAG: hypothetical protein MZV63_63785 [Marinilabiliales bacterium]|nr:hypothetical protein [Marinilabiliales bacterium]